MTSLYDIYDMILTTRVSLSEVSTSSGWSFSSQGENEDSVQEPGASLGLGLETAEERSRRLSKLPPAEVSNTEL